MSTEHLKGKVVLENEEQDFKWDTFKYKLKLAHLKRKQGFPHPLCPEMSKGLGLRLRETVKGVSHCGAVRLILQHGALWGLQRMYPEGGVNSLWTPGTVLSWINLPALPFRQSLSFLKSHFLALETRFRFALGQRRQPFWPHGPLVGDSCFGELRERLLTLETKEINTVRTAVTLVWTYRSSS